MATTNFEILEASYDDGAFKKRPNDLQRIYFRASTITAWEIIEVIESRAELGVTGEAIALQMGCNYNTVNVFLRWLVDKKMVEFETPKGDHDQPMQARVYRLTPAALRRWKVKA